jgi:hypothetical protein
LHFPLLLLHAKRLQCEIYKFISVTDSLIAGLPMLELLKSSHC